MKKPYKKPSRPNACKRRDRVRVPINKNTPPRHKWVPKDASLR